jgi:two-component system NtrC family sensor kinase
VLSVDNQVSDREFSEGDQHLLCTLADYAAVSIENATLYSELRKSIDELKCSQQGLIQSSKLAALGRLTASLAHEINNPLQAIRSCISILANRSLDQDKRETYLGIADKELARLAQLVDRMLDFHRPSMGSRGPTDVNALLDDTLTLVSKQLQHSDITLSKQLTPDLPPVEAAASYLRQVFINLVLNAAEAMPEGGTLVVSTGLDVENGQLVMVFTDTGVGIPADSLPYIFEPFYTTKSSGSGLGLSISYAIVEQQGGRMEVKSVEGEGATFTIRLPLNGERDA